MSEILHEGTVRAIKVNPDWVFINWCDPGKRKFSAIKDVLKIERKLKEEGLTGWYASSEKDHTTMHAILSKMGAKLYGENEHSLLFMKEVA